MPTQMNIHDAKTNLSKLIEEAMDGGTVIIAKAGKPQVRLVPVEPVSQGKRVLGWARDTWTAPDDIDSGFEHAVSDMFRLAD